MQDRLETLELKMMSTEDNLDTLNRTVWEQGREIELLRTEFRNLLDQLKALQSRVPPRPEDEIPPHY